MAVVKIDSTIIKQPHEVKIGVFRLSKSGRLSSGKMVMDIIALKRRVDLKWNSIRGKDLKSIMDLLNNNTFYTIEYPDPGTETGLASMTAYVGDINADWHRYETDSTHIYKNVTLPFIEQ